MPTKALLDQAVRDYLTKDQRHLVNEIRSVPGGLTVSEFQEDVKSHINSEFDEVGGNLDGPNKIGVAGTGESVRGNIRDAIESYIKKQFGQNIFDEKPVLLPPRQQPTTDGGDLWTDVYESVSDMGSSSYYGIWTVVEGSVFYWKLSTAESTGTSLRAEDYELTICAGYNAYKDRQNPENPFVQDGEIDPLAQVPPDNAKLQEYTNKAVFGSPSEGDYNTVSAGMGTGLGVIKRNRELQNKGEFATQFGAASAETSSQYQGKDNTPKTDLFFEDGTNVSLKKSGSSQLVSGQVEDSKAIFEGALHFFNESEKTRKRKLKEDVMEEFDRSFEKIDRPTKKKTVQTIKEAALSAYKENRIEELESVADRLIPSGGQLELETASGDRIVLKDGDDYRSVLVNHAKAELKYHGLSSRQGKWRRRLIQRDEFLIGKKELVQRIDRQFGSKEAELIDENSKKVLKRVIDHREITETVKELVEEDSDFGKYVVFEAATGFYKFDGPSSSPFRDLQSASRPVANSYLVFDQASGMAGQDKYAKITKNWAQSKAENINIRVSFKTRGSGFYSTLRLESEKEETKEKLSPLEEIFEEERRKMVSDVIEKSKRRSQLYEFSLGQAVQSGINTAIQKGKDMLSYMVNRFNEFVESVKTRIKNLIENALDQGLDAFMNALGIEVEAVRIDPIEI